MVRDQSIGNFAPRAINDGGLSLNIMELLTSKHEELSVLKCNSWMLRQSVSEQQLASLTCLRCECQPVQACNDLHKSIKLTFGEDLAAATTQGVHMIMFIVMFEV